MTDTAIYDTTRELHARIAAVVGGNSQVHIGAPIRNEMGTARVSVFMFHCDVNVALRNEIRYKRPPPNEPAGTAVAQVDSLPMDLRYLITVFRDPSASGPSPNEFEKLGKIIQTLHVQPTLATPKMRGQVVRVSPEPYPMEELSRLWGLFGQDTYRTSMVYLATPVFIDAQQVPMGAPVTKRQQTAGSFGRAAGGGS